MDEKIRNWEKGTAIPIPDSKYEKFKEEIKESSKKYSDRNFILFILARATGYRLGDLVGLTIGQIEDALDDGYFLIQENKQYKQWLSCLKDHPDRKKPDKRKAPVGNSLRRYLKEYIKGKKRKQFAFPSNKGDGNEFISQKSFSEILKSVGEKIGLKHITGHSPRKTYATVIYEESDHDIKKVSTALNHQSIEETQRYLGIKEQMIDEAGKIADRGL
jgi:integrase